MAFKRAINFPQVIVAATSFNEKLFIFRQLFGKFFMNSSTYNLAEKYNCHDSDNSLKGAQEAKLEQ